MLAETEIVEVEEPETFPVSAAFTFAPNLGKPRELMTRSELARYLGCGVRAVDGMTMSGLPSRRLLGEPIYNRRDVEAWLRSA